MNEPVTVLSVPVCILYDMIIRGLSCFRCRVTPTYTYLLAFEVMLKLLLNACANLMLSRLVTQASMGTVKATIGVVGVGLVTALEAYLQLVHYQNWSYSEDNGYRFGPPQRDITEV
jgi:hypothetical protein